MQVFALLFFFFIFEKMQDGGPSEEIEEERNVAEIMIERTIFIFLNRRREINTKLDGESIFCRDLASSLLLSIRL